MENYPPLMLVVEGMVMVAASNAPSMAPITRKPFMLVMEAVITTEVSPERGEEMVMVGVVYIWMSVLRIR